MSSRNIDPTEAAAARASAMARHPSAFRRPDARMGVEATGRLATSWTRSGSMASDRPHASGGLANARRVRVVDGRITSPSTTRDPSPTGQGGTAG